MYLQGIDAEEWGRPGHSFRQIDLQVQERVREFEGAEGVRFGSDLPRVLLGHLTRAQCPQVASPSPIQAQLNGIALTAMGCHGPPWLVLARPGLPGFLTWS